MREGPFLCSTPVDAEAHASAPVQTLSTWAAQSPGAGTGTSPGSGPGASPGSSPGSTPGSSPGASSGSSPGASSGTAGVVPAPAAPTRGRDCHGAFALTRVGVESLEIATAFVAVAPPPPPRSPSRRELYGVGGGCGMWVKSGHNYCTLKFKQIY